MDDDDFDVMALLQGLTPGQVREFRKGLVSYASALRDRIAEEPDEEEPAKSPREAQQDEKDRLAQLDAAEKEEISRLPRGVAGLRSITSVQTKYQSLRYGAPKPDGSLEALRLQRASKAITPPDTTDQKILHDAYDAECRKWRGNVGMVSYVQGIYRRAGLKI